MMNVIKNVSELEVGNLVQYIGNTNDLCGTIMQVVSINPDKNQCHIEGQGHGLSRCDVKNIIVLKGKFILSTFQLPKNNRRAFDVDENLLDSVREFAEIKYFMARAHLVGDEYLTNVPF